MRSAAARLLGLLLSMLTVALLVAPQVVADPPFRLSGQVTDRAGALSAAARTEVQTAVDNLYRDRKIRLWVVYVRDFSDQDPQAWAQMTYRTSGLSGYDSLLAVATDARAYWFRVPDSVTSIKASQVSSLQRDKIEPALHTGDWAAAADGLNAAGSEGSVSWVGLLAFVGVVLLGIAGLLLFVRWRRRRRRAAEAEAARRVDPGDPNALAALSVDALDDLSKSMVVDVDNAVRTSDNELALAVEEFGDARTEPFTRAVANAKSALAQAFSLRQQLDDAIPESSRQRREMLTRVITSAATADRELDAQTTAFEQLRDLVINAPSKLDSLTQQLVDLTARTTPSREKLATLHNEFDDAALTAVAGNVNTAQERITFADDNITRARELATHPMPGQQGGLVDSVRAAESALGQARSLLDAVDSAESDIKHAAATLPEAIADIQNGIQQADAQFRQGNVPQAEQLTTARDAAAQAVANAQATGATDPLGAFTQLTRADAELDRLLAGVEEEREAAVRLTRALDQALFTAQSRVRAVSDYIDTRRGSIGPEARTRLAEAARQLDGAHANRASDVNQAMAYANGASMLAAQAQSLANADVQSAQQSYAGRYGGGGGGSNAGAIIGGIIIGNILSGGFGGRGGGIGGGWIPTSFGGSGGSSGGGFMGGGGRF
jgi:predicted  nucleic acid-binding Zn-ribbon protein